MTYHTLVKQIEALQLTKLNLQSQLEALPGLVFIRSAIAKASIFDNEKELVQYLIEEICQRDEPMTFDYIKQIFEATGWTYTDQDVQSCNPESYEFVYSCEID